MATIVESKQKKTTIDQYLDNEVLADFKSEFIDGEVLAMAGASVRHVKLTMNMSFQYMLALDRQNKSCELVNSDQILYVEECKSLYYPDLMLICGKPEYFHHKSSGRHALLNPTVIFEIISNSTQYMDRITKWACYKTIPSLKEYILINQYDYQIEKYERKGKKEWLMTEFNQKEDKISINEIEISLSEIYKNTENLPVE